MARHILPVHLKILVPFIVVTCACCGIAVLAVVQMTGLMSVLRESTEANMQHESLGRFRRGLLALDLHAQRFILRHTADDHAAFVSGYAALASQAEECDGCHARRGADPRAAEVLEPVHDLVGALSDAEAPLPPGRVLQLLDQYEVEARTFGAALGAMEDRIVSSARTQGKSAELILRRSLVAMTMLIAAALFIVVVMAVWLARGFGTPLLRLIEGAQRIGAGDLSYRVQMPREPNMARLTRCLNEMTARVAAHAREGERRLLLDKIIASQEDERKRIARELHDQVGQSLAALLMAMRSQDSLAKSRESFAASLSRLIEQVRQLAWDIRPSILSDHGLDAALTRYLDDTAARTGIPVDFQRMDRAETPPPDGVMERIPEHVETVVYRVAQEAVSNAVCHAHCSRVSVVLWYEEGRITLLVEDDGVGFDVTQVRGAGGVGSLGLLGMEERVELAGGELAIDSAPGAGCSVRARIPTGA